MNTRTSLIAALTDVLQARMVALRHPFHLRYDENRDGRVCGRCACFWPTGEEQRDYPAGQCGYEGPAVLWTDEACYGDEFILYDPDADY